MGGYEKAHMNGTITYVPVSNTEYWEFKLDKVVLNQTSSYNKRVVNLCSQGCLAYPNTGDFLIYGPANDIKTINRFLYADYIPYLDRYEVSWHWNQSTIKILQHYHEFHKFYHCYENYLTMIRPCQNSIFQISCSRIHKLPKVVFYIGGTMFTLTGRDYVEQVIEFTLKYTTADEYLHLFVSLNLLQKINYCKLQNTLFFFAGYIWAFEIMSLCLFNIENQ